MNRRTVLGGMAAAGALGGSLWFAMADSRFTTTGANPDGDADGEASMAPQEIETLAAPGSSAGTLTVPVPGEVTVVDAFATWCAPCREQMVQLNAAHDAVGGRARFVSVSNEAIGGDFQRSDVAEWWANHDGDWTVGLERQGNVTSELRVSGLPFVAIVDATGRVTWTHQGVTDGTTIVERVESALA